MKPRSLPLGAAALGLALAMQAPPAAAGVVTYTTKPGATVPSSTQPVSVTATFVTGPGTLDITLTNNVIDPTSDGQLLSAVYFTLAGVTAAPVYSAPTANLVTIAADGTFTSVSGALTRWQTANTGGNTYRLSEQDTSGPKSQQIIGAPDATTGLYDNANSSIRNHNASAQGPVTFHLAIAGLTSDTVISGVRFNMGTAVSLYDGVPSTPPSVTPEPSTLALAGMAGCGGLFALARRRKATAA